MCTLTSAEYGDVRLALGLASMDTTTLPDATIASRAFGALVQRRVTTALECCTDWSCDDGDADYDADKTDSVKTALVYYVAAALAEGWLTAKADARIKSERLGNQAVTYDATDWTKVAGELAQRAHEAMRWACPCAADELAGEVGDISCDLISVNGPSRYEVDQDEIDDRIDQLTPWGIGGP